jgi:putative FmdB family regulatory protein
VYKRQIFEYRCEGCGHRFDAFFRHAEDADSEKLECANCGSSKVKKMFSVIGIGGMDKGQAAGGCSTTTRST